MTKTDLLAESALGPLKMTVDGVFLMTFMEDWSFVTIVRGPWASGKSVACCGKMFTAACRQAPNANGVRRTRWAVVRNTYPDLRETTIKTWLEWFPEAVYGPMRQSRPYQHIIRLPGEPHNGKPTTVEMEVLFLALDDDEDRKKLLSMELTGCWINEAREIDKPIIDDIIGRTGRFPPKRDGGHTWSGGFMDTNAPAETHWLPIMMGDSPFPDDMSEDERAGLKKPDDWNYYVQPGALIEKRDAAGRHDGWEANPAAENISNLTDGFDYYFRRAGGKPLSWVRVNFCNRLGSLVSGKPVWPTFDKAKHVAARPLAYNPNLHLYVGIDQTGRNPAAVFGQRQQNGIWHIIAELVAKDTNREAFAPQVKAMVAKLAATAGLSFQQVSVSFFRDPHDQKDDTEGQTATMVYRQSGISLVPAPGGNGIKMRTETIEVLFDNGKILISPNCSRLIAACEGGYRFRKLKISGAEIYDATPDKRNGHADVADGLQYMALGAGEGRTMVMGSERKPVVVAISGYRPGKNRQAFKARRA